MGVVEHPPDPCTLVLTYNDPDDPDGTQHMSAAARC